MSNELFLNKKGNQTQIKNKGIVLTKKSSKKFLNILKNSDIQNINTIDYSNINYSDRLKYKGSNKKYTNNYNVNLKKEFANTLKQPKKKLAIIKDGIIYWLRKLYFILSDKTININSKKNLYMCFYYPIKDINLKIKRKFSYKIGDRNEIFCKNLDDIYEEVKYFLKIPNLFESLKVDIFNEDFVIIKNDNQLMEKKEKYKILYMKITKLSDEQKNKKLNRCQFHKRHRQSVDFNNSNLPFYLFTNKELKNRISIDNYFSSFSPEEQNKFFNNNEKSDINILRKENDKYFQDNKENLINMGIINQNYTSTNMNKNLFNIDNHPSLFINLKHMRNRNKNLNRNYTDNSAFPRLNIHKYIKSGKLYENKKDKMIEVKSPFQKYNLNGFYKKYNIPIIKSNGLWNPKNTINTNYLKSSTLPNKYINKTKNAINLNNKIIDYDDSKTMEEDSDNYINLISSNESRNNHNCGELNEYSNIKTHNYDNDDINKYLKFNYQYTINDDELIHKNNYQKKLILKDPFLEKDPCDDVFNINIKNNFNEMKITKVKYHAKFIGSNNYKIINSNNEINQIQFIALNTCIRTFILEKIDICINEEKVNQTFNKEQIIKNIKEINNDIPINIYLKEFLCFTYLSNYINKYHIQFCNDFCYVLKDYYININNILSINKFKDFIHDFKKFFHILKSNKIIIEKLTENYMKNNKKISNVFFILFLIYNKKNLSTLFEKELLLSLLECIDINLNNDINIEQFIKFKLFFIKNKWINEDMKKTFITKFFNIFIAKHKNLDDDLFIIKLRPIINITSENIKKIEKNNFYNYNIDEIFTNIIEYFNF